MPEPELSLVVLQHGQHHLTRRCVESLRAGTRAGHEVIVVDNGSPPPSLAAAHILTDKVVELGQNAGFAAGMNAGAGVATGRYVAFVNNDTLFPRDWDDVCLSHFSDGSIGGVYPAVTAAGIERSVRTEAGGQPERLLPFERPPSAVVVLLARDHFGALGGWNESYPIASGEDADLAFTTWLNDLDLVLEPRTLIQHVGKATTLRTIPNWRRVWHDNGMAFLHRWAGASEDMPRLPHCSVTRWERNRRTARAAAQHLLELQDCRDRWRWAVGRRLGGRIADRFRQREL